MPEQVFCPAADAAARCHGAEQQQQQQQQLSHWRRSINSRRVFSAELAASLSQ